MDIVIKTKTREELLDLNTRLAQEGYNTKPISLEYKEGTCIIPRHNMMVAYAPINFVKKNQPFSAMPITTYKKYLLAKLKPIKKKESREWNISVKSNDGILIEKEGIVIDKFNGSRSRQTEYSYEEGSLGVTISHIEALKKFVVNIYIDRQKAVS